jgi:hypothetical protein
MHEHRHSEIQLSELSPSIMRGIIRTALVTDNGEHTSAVSGYDLYPDTARTEAIAIPGPAAAER